MYKLIFYMLLAAVAYGQVFPAQNIGFVGLTVQNITMYVSSVTLITMAATGGQLGRLKIPGFSYLIVLFFVVMVSLVYVAYAGEWGILLIDNARLAKTQVFEPILLYLISFILVQSRKQGLLFLKYFIVVLGIINVATLVASVFNVTLFQIGQHYLEAGRFVGFTGNPNKTSYLLCIVIAFQYYFMKNSHSRLATIAYSGLMLGCVVTILMSGSRGGLLGLVLVAFFLARIWRDYKSLLLFPALVLPIVVGLLLAMENQYLAYTWERIASLTSSDVNVVTSSRFDIWGGLFDAYTSSFRSVLIGNGFGVAEYLGVGARAHNMYLQVLVEFGGIGIGFWIFGILRVRKYAKKLCTIEAELSQLARTMVACIYLVLFAWLFTTLIGILELLGLLFGLTIATLIVRQRKKVILVK